ncbi:MAG: PA14 domain-containing protein [Chloroflexota bacterium]
MLNTQILKTLLLALIAACTVAFTVWDRVSFAFITQPSTVQSLSAQQAGGTTLLKYDIDRSQIPDLYYDELTIDIQTNGAPIVSVRANRPDTPFTILEDADYSQPDANTVRVNTSARLLEVTVNTPANTAGLGNFTVPDLKNDKAFAFSVGMDDNTNLQTGIDLMTSKGWQGTLYLIGQYVEDRQPNEDWIITYEDIRNLVAQGWAIGNHTWDHACGSIFGDQNIRDTQTHLRNVINTSSVPEYKIHSFAAPCFDAAYHPLILNLRDNDPNVELLFNESGGPYIMQVDPDTTQIAFQYNAVGVGLFDFDAPVGRDWDLANAPAAVDALMAEHNNSGSHFWYNVLVHGNQNAELTDDDMQPIIDHVYNQYGPGSNGNDIVWVAPAEKIYSYLLVRDRSTIYFSQHVDPTVTPTLDPNAPTPTTTPTFTPTNTPPPTPDPRQPNPPESGIWYGLYEAWLTEEMFTAAFDWSQQTPVGSGTLSNFDVNVNNPGRDQHYQVRYVGCVGIPTSGTYTFYVTSDDGTALFIENQLVIDNTGKIGADSNYGPREASGTVTLQPGWRQFELKYNQFDAGRALIVEYEGPGLSRQVIPNDLLGCSSGPVPTPGPTALPTAIPTPTPDPNAPALPESGIWYGLYEAWLTEEMFTAAFDWSGQTLVGSGTLNNFDVNVNNPGRDQHYQVRYLGCVGIPASGTYTFYVTSDDGTALFIENQLVVDNVGKIGADSNYGPREASSTVTLEPGWRQFELKYNQFDAGRALTVEYEGPGLARQVIPNESLGCSTGPVPTTGPTALPTPTPTLANTPTPTPDPNAPALPESGIGYKLYTAWLGNDGFPATFDWSSISGFFVGSGTLTTFGDDISLLTSTDHYQVQYTGCIGVPSNGTYTFHVESDDGAHLFINDQLVVSNGGKVEWSQQWTPHQGSGSIALAPGYHPFELKYNQFDWNRTLSIEYEGPGVTLQPIPNSALGCGTGPVPTPVPIPTPIPVATPTATPDPNAPALPESGIWYGLYQEWLGDNDFPAGFDWSDKPLVNSGTLDNFDIEVNNPDRIDHYQVRFLGCIGLSAGTYTFHITSDDGAYLFINDQLVVSNSGKVGWSPQWTPHHGSGTITVSADYHPFELTYNQFDWNKTLEIKYEGPGIDGIQPVPNDALGCKTGPAPTPAPTATAPTSPLPTPTQPISPLALPNSSSSTSHGTQSASIGPNQTWEERFPEQKTFILGDPGGTPSLTEAEKLARKQNGLPIPLESIPDETNLPRQFGPWEGTALTTSGPSVFSAGQGTTPTIVDGWDQRNPDSFESPIPPIGRCVWRAGYNTNKTAYQWGRATNRVKNGIYAIWPAGMPLNGQPAIPNGGGYPQNLETWWQCELSPSTARNNILVEFEMWHELDNAGDSLELRFYESACNNTNPSTYQSGLEWEGIDGQGTSSANEWKNHRIFFPSLANSSSSICIEFKFTSDSQTVIQPPAQGPWLDDVQVSYYHKPSTSVNCQDKNPTITVLGAPGNAEVSKSLVVNPYSIDIEAGDVDNPGNDIDMAGMVERLMRANVNWMRLEFMIPPSELMRIGRGLGYEGVSQVDLRHFDRIVDMLCANNIAVLGLVDNQTLERQDWNDEIDAYKADFAGTAKQLASYYDDRIRYWEIWNEPNFGGSEVATENYAQLLVEAYDGIKSVEPNDKILFAGLAQADGRSLAYFAAVSQALADLDNPRQNPAPYDILALHPYPSDQYVSNNRVIVDPTIYLRQIDDIAKPTTIHNYFETMIANGKNNGEIWITEIGWNRARDNTIQAQRDINESCGRVSSTMVRGTEQSTYAHSSFDLLFKQTAWSSGTPSIKNIFWFGYGDTGLPENECDAGVTGASVSPSNGTSFIARGASLLEPQQDDASWWFGLYQGIDWRPEGPVMNENTVHCIFRNYPIDTAVPLFECLDIVFLPLIHNSGVASGQ